MTNTTQLKMISKDIWDQAKQQCPQLRLENVRYFGPLVILLTIGLQHQFLPHFLGTRPPLWISAIVVLVYLLAALLDTYSTHRCMCLKPAFEKHGYQFPIWESNPMMPPYLTLKQNLLSWPSLFSLVGALVVFFMPAVGIGASLLHLFAAWGNQRIRRRALLQLALARL